jgi:thiol-disulfide isomerase/thioredoxin
MICNAKNTIKSFLGGLVVFRILTPCEDPGRHKLIMRITFYQVCIFQYYFKVIFLLQKNQLPGHIISIFMKSTFLIIICIRFMALAFSQDKLPHALMVGDNAPILPLDKWIKGGPLNIYDKGKVYLIDFWAVWCGPCIAGMENLSELQKKYKNNGLEVISATSEDAWGNSYDKVEKFINTKGEKFDYNFAWLPQSYRSDRKYYSIIYNSWLDLAYDSSSWALPQVFLIDRSGKIAFIGDGYSLTEDYLVKVLKNSYNLSEERKNYIERLRLEDETTRFLQFLDNKNLLEAKNLGAGILNNPNVSTHTLLVISDNIFNEYKGLNDKDLLNLGLEAAKKGVSLTESESPSHLSVLAKGYSLLNNPEQAIIAIKSAINLSEGDFKEALQKDLVLYEDMLKKKTGN